MFENSLPGLKQFAGKHQKSLTLLLVMNGFLGAVAGIKTATWQFPVETAQFLLRLVSYGPGTLPYMYNAAPVSMINHIACLLLALTRSEMISSLLIAALVGGIMRQTMAMAIFLVYRNVWMATLATACLLALDFMGNGIAYPIFLASTEHTFGRIGLFFILYAALFLAFSKYRTGFLLSGLALWMHPAWGVWLNACLFITVALKYRAFKNLLKTENLIYFFSGAGLSAAAFIVQRLYFPVDTGSLPPADPHLTKEIFLNYIRYWDYHRQKFDNPTLLFRGFSLAGVCLYVAVSFLRERKAFITLGEKLFFSFVILSTLLSACLVFIPSWFDPRYFPESFIALMPGRFINTPIFLCTPLLLGSGLSWLSRIKNESGYTWLQAGRILCLGLAVDAIYDYESAILCAGLVLALLCFVLHTSRHRLPGKSLVQRFSVTSSMANAWMLIVCGVILMLTTINSWNAFPQTKAQFGNVTIPLSVRGAILTTDSLLQIKSRISVLTPHLDGYVYVGRDAMVPFSHMAKDIFGISLLSSPPAHSHLHQSSFLVPDYQTLWEGRSCREWEQLSSLYHFDFIVVPADLHLRLPAVDIGMPWNGYRPFCR